MRLPVKVVVMSMETNMNMMPAVKKGEKPLERYSV